MARPNKAQAAQIAERRTKAIEMRARREPWQRIADALGYGSADHACQDVGRAIEQRNRAQTEAVDALREIELEHLDELSRTVWAVLEREHVTVSHGKVIVIKDEAGVEHRLRDDGPTLAAVDRLVKIAERRARLLGLDSAVKVDARGVVTFAIEGIDPEKLR